nr:hypothetical protein [Tanacetum cinerariifolium]
VNDVTRLQALVDKKKVVVTEGAIREVLWLDDSESVDCLPNKEIFTELARMGYEKPSTKLTFYKAFFSSHSAMAFAVICFSIGDLSTHTTKYALPTLTQKVFANIKRVGKGFSEVETPLFEGMMVRQEIEEEGVADEHVKDVTAGDDAQEDDTAAHREVLTVQPPLPQPQAQQQVTDFPMSLLQEALDACAALARRVEHLEYDKVAQHLEITKLKRRVKRLEKGNKGRMIDEMDKDDAVVLMDEKEEDKKVEEAKDDEPTKVQEVVDVVTTAKDPEEESTTSSIISTETKSKDKGKGIMVEESKPLKKKQQIEMDEEYARKLYAELNKNIDWDVAIDHNVAGFKLDYFKGMSYDDIRPIFKAKFNSNVEFLLKIKEQMEEEENRALQSINETPA